MYEQVTVTVSHIIATLCICVEFTLRVDADVVAHKLVLQHKMFKGVLLGAWVPLIHQHFISHHLKYPASEGRAAEKHAAGVDALVVLRDQNVDVLHTKILGGVDVRGVILEFAVKYWRVAHKTALESSGREDLIDKVIVRCHYDNVGVNEPDPFGGWVKGKRLGDGGNLRPCLQLM